MGMRVGRRAAVLAGLALAAAAVLVACAPADPGDAVVEGIVALSDGDENATTLASMTTFDWDEVYLFPESTPVGEITERTGIELSGGLISGDHLLNTTLVFRHEGHVVAKVQTTGAPLAFDSAHTWQPYPYPGELEVVGAAVRLRG
ncbi:hypothetical protein [Microbacterium gorillae]|uniref:hypothetical protein n=1 Tax=Microbacterium gorillae TaxID=1231063 RepID=UPI003D9986E1